MRVYNQLNLFERLRLAIVLTVFVVISSSAIARPIKCEKALSGSLNRSIEDSLHELARMQLELQILPYSESQILHDKFKKEMNEALRMSQNDQNIIVRYQQIVKEMAAQFFKEKKIKNEKVNESLKLTEKQKDNLNPIRLVDIYKIDVPNLRTDSPYFLDVHFSSDGKYLIFSDITNIIAVEFEGAKLKQTKIITDPAGEELYHFTPHPNAKEVIVKKPDPKNEYSFKYIFDIYSLETTKKTGSIKLAEPLENSSLKISNNGDYAIIGAREFDKIKNEINHVFYLYDMKLEKVVKKYFSLSTKDNRKYTNFEWLSDNSGFIIETEKTFALIDINTKDVISSYVKDMAHVNWDIKLSPSSKFVVVAPVLDYDNHLVIKTKPVILKIPDLTPLQKFKFSQKNDEINITFDQSSDSFFYTTEYRHILFDGVTLKPLYVLPIKNNQYKLTNLNVKKDIYFHFKNEDINVFDLKGNLIFSEKSSLESSDVVAFSIMDPAQSLIVYYRKGDGEEIVLEVFENRRREK